MGGEEKRGLLWNLRMLQNPPINLHLISANNTLPMLTTSVGNANLKHHIIVLGNLDKPESSSRNLISGSVKGGTGFSDVDRDTYCSARTSQRSAVPRKATEIYLLSW